MCLDKDQFSPVPIPGLGHRPHSGTNMRGFRRSLIRCLLIAGSLSSSVGADQPNILFLMSDDHAAHALGAYGGRLARLDPTPAVDKLASAGMLLENAFCTNSICTPSRATLRPVSTAMSIA